MKYRNIKLDSFGPIGDSFEFQEDRINLILAPNEAGKSTLVRSLVALLYGLESDKRKARNEEKITELEFYRPWEGDRYTVSGELLYQDAVLEVVRDFSDESVEIYEDQTGKEVTEEYITGDSDQKLGRTLTGLSRRAFEKSVLVHQKDLGLEGGKKDLVMAIQKMADTAVGQATARKALENLEEARTTFRGREVKSGKLTTEKERVRSRIEEIEQEMEDLRSERKEAEEKIKKAEKLKEQIEDIEDELDRVDFLETVARKRELEETLEKNRKRSEKLDKLTEELEELKEFESFPHGQHENVLRSHEHRKQKLENLEKVEKKLKNKKEKLEKIEGQLEKMDHLENVELQELKNVSEFCEKAIHYRGEIQDALEEEEEEKRQLEKPVELREEYHELQEVFNELSRSDREFLNEINQRLRDLSDLEAESERRISEAKEKISEIDSERDRKRIWYAVTTGAIILVAASVLLSALLTGLPDFIGYLFAVVGLGGGAYTTVVTIRAGNHRADERSEWQVKLENLTEDQTEQVRKRRNIQKKATTLAGSLGFEDTEELLNRYERYRSLYSKLESLLQVEAQRRREEKKLENLIQKNKPLLERCEKEFSAKESTQEEFEAFRDTVKRYREKIKEQASTEADLADLEAEMNKLKREKNKEETTLRSIMERAGIEVEESLDEAVETFKEMDEKYIRLQTIKEQIPEVKENLLPEDELEESHRMYDQMKTHLENIQESRPEMEIPDQVARKEEYSQRRKTLTGKKESLIADRADLEREVGSIESRFREKYPDLQDRKEDLSRYSKQLIQLKEAVKLAEGVLEDISDEVHAEWARILNEMSSEYVEKMTPGYKNIRFDSDLSFTIESENRDRPLSPVEVRNSLSTGTTDQIFMAVRLGLSKFLSRTSETLPIVLDEPFAHFDDSRFEETMRLLSGAFLSDNQIIYLTCHRSRVEWLKEQNPSWFNETFKQIDLEQKAVTQPD